VTHLMSRDSTLFWKRWARDVRINWGRGGFEGLKVSGTEGLRD
jgi:hypothetical protein